MTGNEWLWRHLEQTGVVGPDRVGRTARATACRTCHGPTLTGLDNDMCATVAHADPEPIDTLGEALALLAGRKTYALHPSANGYELVLRYDKQIAGAQPGARRYDVLAEHACNSAALPGRPSAYTGITALPDNPPY